MKRNNKGLCAELKAENKITKTTTGLRGIDI
jgi:hypothetical protein